MRNVTKILVILLVLAFVGVGAVLLWQTMRLDNLQRDLDASNAALDQARQNPPTSSPSTSSPSTVPPTSTENGHSPVTLGCAATAPAQALQKALPEFLRDSTDQQSVREYLFPNSYDNLTGNDPDLTADTVHYLSIPSPDGRKILRVYAQASCQDADPDCFCQLQSMRLVLVDEATGARTYLGASPMIQQANSGGIFVPFAFTRDGSGILLRAWMGSPGAGGGSIDYGYFVAPIKPVAKIDTPLFQGFPKDTFTAASRIYADNSKVVYLTHSDLTPEVQPGPSNDGKLVYRDLLTGKETILLETKDTGYEFKLLDETKKTLTLTVIKYAFTSPDCTRENGSFECAAQTRSEKTIPLP